MTLMTNPFPSRRTALAAAALGAGLPVVVYCAHGHEISQGLSAALRAMAVDARHLEGGISAWKAAGHEVQPAPG